MKNDNSIVVFDYKGVTRRYNREYPEDKIQDKNLLKAFNNAKKTSIGIVKDKSPVATDVENPWLPYSKYILLSPAQRKIQDEKVANHNRKIKELNKHPVTPVEQPIATEDILKVMSKKDLKILESLVKKYRK